MLLRSSDMTTHVMWFRRDLRWRDNPALLEATAADDVVPLFVFDERLWEPSGPTRRVWLLRSLRALAESIDNNLLVRGGDPVDEVIRVARAASAEAVHIAADYGPYGSERDSRVEKALAEHDIALIRTGSPYAIAPGRIRKDDGTPYSVFSPFYRAWLDHGWRAPAATPRAPHWVRPLKSIDLPREPDLGAMNLPTAGEEAALRRWRAFRDGPLMEYAEMRNRPDQPGTSAMSAHLKYGEIHPRTLLTDLAGQRGKNVESYRSELAWREFYADVLFHHPRSAREYLRPDMARMTYATGKTADEHFRAWSEGRTGFPFVDAGMRQLRAEGWVHNRVRMVVASFLVKDLHIEWQRGAREFMHWLRDGDLASNNHGWQWVAGSGTDAAPYFRVFNPVTQGRKFDPDGDYVRRYVPELRSIEGAAVHEPWALPDGVPAGYPERIVDHAEERKVALARYEAVRR
jgi:deoxyribodipyrimidine photo-lyase